MKDYIVRATAANAQIRAFAVTSRELVETARAAHNTSPVVTAALGRLMTGALMMGGMLKGEEDILTLRIRGEGPVHGLTVTADAAGHLGLRILVWAAAILDASAQAQNPEALEVDNAVLRALAALRRMPVIGLVVIAVDVEHRSVGKGGDKGQIFGVQVAAGENQVDSLQAASVQIIPKPRRLLVGQRQNLHRPSSPSAGSGPAGPSS